MLVMASQVLEYTCTVLEYGAFCILSNRMDAIPVHLDVLAYTCTGTGIHGMSAVAAIEYRYCMMLRAILQYCNIAMAC